MLAQPEATRKRAKIRIRVNCSGHTQTGTIGSGKRTGSPRNAGRYRVRIPTAHDQETHLAKGKIMTYNTNPLPGSKIRKIAGSENNGEYGTVLGTYVSQWSGMNLVGIIWDNGKVTTGELPEALEILPIRLDDATREFNRIHRSDPVNALVTPEKDTGYHFAVSTGSRPNR